MMLKSLELRKEAVEADTSDMHEKQKKVLVDLHHPEKQSELASADAGRFLEQGYRGVVE